MNEEDLDELVKDASELKFDRFLIHLYEQKQEFDKCVNIYLESPRVKSINIFSWLFNLFRVRDKKKEHRVQELKKKISNSIEDLINIDPTQTGNIIEVWLPDKQKDVINKLGKKPELQLKYLESYLLEREDDIIDKFAESSISIRSSPEANNYKTYLIKHVELLAKQSNPKLIEIVKKNFYPLEWLDKVPGSASPLIQEARGYLKKRAGMHLDAIKIFTEILKNIDKESINQDVIRRAQNIPKEPGKPSFEAVFQEIIDSLKSYSKGSDYSHDIWISTLKTMFELRNKLSEKEDKSDLVNKVVYSKIDELMHVMSEYVDFKQILSVLNEIDKELRYQHAKMWFKSLFMSKNDQEVLYDSAQRLLSNENSSLIDNIIERNNIGFIGERDKQI